ncbi:pilus assembly protein [Microvirga makkahensis]|uniref:Pilus assembly protein n=1 Tax=Microvirga makkahensis TaxID=1128670 RepID=A0A7X3MPB2_9HYPH|nr:pilus assembly protein [Microvirga makkahensis]MXQ10680.1 pilus assembly protein [Microvirga makkahensis]
MTTSTLGGCADYLERRDTITFAAGEAQAWNRVVHTVDPWPPYVTNTRITSDGERVARATRSYFDGGADANTGAAAALPDQDGPATPPGQGGTE